MIFGRGHRPDRIALRLILILSLFLILFASPCGPSLTEAAAAESGRTIAKQTPGSHPTREAIIRETNKARARKDLQALRENEVLNRIAEERLDDLLAKQYFGHVSPSGEGVDAVAKRAGYRFRRLGENLGNISPTASSRQFVNGWMNSPPHRKNILHPYYRDIGVAVRKGRLKGAESWIAVQIFGSR